MAGRDDVAGPAFLPISANRHPCVIFALLEIARLTPGGPLCRLAAMTKISATAAKDTTSTAPENA